MKGNKMKKPVYKRELSHSYLVIHDVPQEKVNGYQYRMIVRNKIAGLLPCSERFLEGKTCLYYDISSRQSLVQVYESTEMNYEQIRQVIENLTQIQGALTDYLLRESGLVLEPEYIYMDMETEQLYFLYYPVLAQEPEEGNLYLSLAEFFLEHVNHGEEQAVSTAYQFYKMSKLENFTIESFRAMIEKGKTEETAYVKTSPNELLFREEEGIYEYRLRPGLAGAPYIFEEEETEELSEEKENDSKNGGKRPRGALIRLILSAGILICACVSFWYVQPSGRSRYMGVGLMILSGLLVLWTFSIFINSVRPKKKTASDKGEKGVSSQKLERGKRHELWDSDPFPGETKENEISGPTVFIGSGYQSVTENPKEEIRRNPRLCMWSEGKEVEYPLDSMPALVGKLKSRVQILLPDASISRIHARFVEKEGYVALIDMNSTNGTYVNEVRLEQEEVVRLEDGDEIRFGNVELTFRE